MANPEKKNRPASRLSVVVFAVLFVLLAAACEGFYTDSPPTPDIALPTPAKLQDGIPEELAETGARNAMAITLGISPDAPRKILLQGATWTDRSPGCYPPPPGVTGPYLVPGYRLLMQYEGIYYEYNADAGGETGALCDSTMQPVPVEPALDIVTVNRDSAVQPDFDIVYILRSEDDVSSFNSTNSNIAIIAQEVIDWTVEVLVGGWVNVNSNAEATRAYRTPSEPQSSSDNGLSPTNIIIEVAVPENSLDDQVESSKTGPSQIWALVDITEPNSTYEFVVPN